MANIKITTIKKLKEAGIKGLDEINESLEAVLINKGAIDVEELDYYRKLTEEEMKQIEREIIKGEFF